jgi:RNA polymerase sigma-70 factor (ECF subfamily)
LLAVIMTIENDNDRAKAAEIYRLHGRLMLYIARGILGDAALAEDAVSEAFIRIIENLEKINMEDCYKTRGFVVIIARHTALNMLRQQKRDKTIPFEDYTDYSNCDEPVFDDVTIREACAKISDVVAGLHKSYADVLYLKFELDYTYDEISKILGISPENVRMRLSRARQALKAQLRKEEIIP